MVTSDDLEKLSEEISQLGVRARFYGLDNAATWLDLARDEVLAEAIVLGEREGTSEPEG